MSVAIAPQPTAIRVTHGAAVGDVIRLADADGYPCVSVLLTMRGRRRVTSTDRAHLDRLIRVASRRLAEEGVPGASRIVSSLRQLAQRATSLAPSAALALYASADHLEIVQLPMPVSDRVVVDPTFATRDLLRAAQIFPPYYVVTLSGRGARLFESAGGTLRESDEPGFPVAIRARRRELSELELLHAVQARLSDLARARRTPIFVVATASRLAAMSEITHVEQVIPVPAGLTAYTGPVMLQRLVAPVLARHQQALDDAALDALRAPLPHRQNVSGLSACWHAAFTEQPELLVVEDGLSAAVRVSPDGAHLTPAFDREHPDVIDDAVDELVEQVLTRGGEVRFLASGSLAQEDGVALRVHLKRP